MSFIFSGNEDPRQREMRLRQQQMDGMQQGLTQMPQNVGQGIQSLGEAIALRQMKQKQAQAGTDPWSGMRSPTGGGGFFSGLSGLMGFGASK